MYSKLKPRESFRGQRIESRQEADWLIEHGIITAAQYESAISHLGGGSSTPAPATAGGNLKDRAAQQIAAHVANGKLDPKYALDLVKSGNIELIAAALEGKDLGDVIVENVADQFSNQDVSAQRNMGSALRAETQKLDAKLETPVERNLALSFEANRRFEERRAKRP